MTPSHATKHGNKRYRYYVCSSAQKRGWDMCPSKSIPAREIERFVIDRIKCVGKDPALLKETVTQAGTEIRAQIELAAAEQRGLERELGRWHAEVRKLVAKGGNGDASRLADLQERISGAERRATELQDQQTRLSGDLLDEAEVSVALSTFEPLWESLAPREQTRIVQLLVERVDYDGANDRVSITFHPTGIKSLAEQKERIA